MITPKIVKNLEKFILPIVILFFPISLVLGLYYALFNSPIDYQQGEYVRIMYVHVPAAWMSLAIYSFIALSSFISLVWRNKMFYILAIAAAPLGASFALITLLTGSLWGKPIWGTWWVWDARLTSMLVLFLLYLSYIIIVNSSNNILRAEKPASVIALIGFVNVPIVKFSVDIWYSLHQPASIIRKQGPSIDSSMMVPLIIMFTSFVLYFILLMFLRTKIILSDIAAENRNLVN